MTEHAIRCRILALVVAMGFVTAAYYHYWLSQFQQMPYPRSTYLFRPDDRYSQTMESPLRGTHMFGDLLSVTRTMRGGDPYHVHPETELSVPSNYPPFMNVLSWFLARVPYPVAVGMFVVLTLGIIGTFWAYALGSGNKAGTWLGVFVLTTMSYPVQTTLDRGNVEVFAFGFTALFLVNYLANRPTAAGAWLGLAAAGKIFPGVFVVVLLLEKRWKASLVFLATAVVATLASSMLLKGGCISTMHAFLAALKDYAHLFNGPEQFICGWGVRSALPFMRPLALQCPHLGPEIGFVEDHFNLILLLPVALALLGASVLAGLKRWERLTLIAALLACAPVPVPDYRLLYLFIPIAAFLREDGNDATPGAVARGRLTAVLFALLLVPWGYAAAWELHESVILRPALLLLICVRIVDFRWRDWVVRRTQSRAAVLRQCNDSARRPERARQQAAAASRAVIPAA